MNTLVGKKNTPSALADDLAKAQERLQQANEKFEADRQGIVERGVARGRHLAELRREIEAEEAEVAKVVGKASVK